ncbi:hypothetical protein GCM10012288_14740 [Malaciobacter pacificus]|uniref:Uncharacterized protein n=1 Tax=Malaciobacter pacificus TaxID=1080223 RepID=A0A5C2HEC3_9BACT|nr:hypothetical protein [Malaciobacter pacificus]QEP35536.1 hypothetical protein APAC_2482 [Malaciobacter pacificus]GGD41616.1 hypothetical protein GCM10012288_14740 [Malaciobacter pacificus]
MKLLFLLSIFFTSIFAETKQVIFVLADDFQSQRASLVQYEKIDGKFKQVSKVIKVNIGENGLAWGESNYNLEVNSIDPVKVEGDKKAVAGIFDLTKIYTYHNFVYTNMPYEKSTENHICVDDSKSNNYNKIIKTKNKQNYNSYENMLLKNETYEYVIVVEHNKMQKYNLGSCIFLHVENPKKKYTSGCTSMKKERIKSIIKWLDISKFPILIQLPRKECSRYQKKYSFINCDI